jgi:hypothetical protein
MSKKIQRPINPKTGKEYSRSWAYRERHPDKAEENRAKLRTPEQLEKSSVRTLKNKEHLREVKRLYYQNNKVRLAKLSRERRKKVGYYNDAHNYSTLNYEKKCYCEICDSVDDLEVHHWNYNNPNLVNTLCRTCHKIQHVKNFERWNRCKMEADKLLEVAN